MTWRLKIKSYLSDAWNRIDQVMYAVLLLAIILRYTLTDDYNFEWARNVYAVDLVMFYLRILQFYFVEKRLGPKVIMIRRMVFDMGILNHLTIGYSQLFTAGCTIVQSAVLRSHVVRLSVRLSVRL